MSTDEQAVVAEDATSPSEKAERDDAPADDRRRLALLVGGLVGLVSLVGYILQAAPSPYLLDSGELVATTWELSVSHPPGHPAYELLAWPMGLLPLGSLAFRTHLSSALAAAMTLALLPYAAVCLEIARDRAEVWLSGLLALALATSFAFAFQATRAEVYALNALLCAGATVVLRPNDTTPRRAGLVAAILGAGLLNHHYLVVAAFPAFAWIIVRWSPAGQRVRSVLTGVIVGGITLLGYLALVARGLARPRTGWGWPDSLGDLWWIVSAQAFYSSTERIARSDAGTLLGKVLGIYGDNFGVLGMVLVLVGFTFLFLRHLTLATFLLLAVAMTALTQVSIDFDPSNPDAAGYFMIGFWWASLAILGGVGVLRRNAGGSGRRVLVTAALLIVVSAAFLRPHTVRDRSLARYWDAHVLLDAHWSRLPPEATVATAFYETAFNIWYARTVLDARPDVVQVHRSFRTYPFYDEQHLGVWPTDAPLFDAADGRRARLSLDAMRQRARARAFFHEPDQLVEEELYPELIPAGLYLQLVPGAPQGELPASLRTPHLEFLTELTSRFSQPLELQVRRNLLWVEFNMARILCEAGRLAHCHDLLVRSSELAPEDRDVADALDRVRSQLRR